MSQVLRQSTQIIVVIGPFVDVSDGFTPEVGITLGAADEAEILKSNTTTTTDISAATWAAISGCDGWYGLTLTTSHTDTIGPLTVMVNDDSVCLPVFARFQVIEEAAYDTIFAASALPASTTNITAGTVTTATNVTTVNGLAANVITAASIAADAITDAKVAADVTIASVTGAVGSVTGNVGGNVTGSVGSVTAAVTVGTINANVITATSINADAITAAKIATGAIDADALATDAVTEIWAGSTAPSAATIADAVWDEDATAHQTGGTFGQAIGDPGADTNTIFKAVVTDATGATVGVDVVDLKTQIGVAGAGLTAIDLPDQTMNITGNITGNLSGSVGSVTGAVGSVTGAVGSVTGNVGGNVNGSVGSVTAGVTVTTNNDKTGYGLSATAVDEIWDEPTAGHSTAGTTGEALTDAGSAGDPWSTALPGAYGAGSAGKIIGDNLNTTVSSRASQTSLDTVDDFLDTEVAAIKAKTDQLTFTVANQVDANIQYVNDVQVTGTGAPGSEWGP
jgi:hypothetical protein